MARVLIDGYWWNDGPPSGKNVVRDLTRSWVSTGLDEITVVVRAGGRASVHEFVGAGRKVSVIELPALVKPHALAVLIMGLFGLSQDVVLTNNFAPPIGGRRARAVFVHDAIFVDHPEWFRWRERLYLSLIPLFLRRATTVFTSSNSEADRIGRVWPFVASRIRPVQLAVPSVLERNPHGQMTSQNSRVLDSLRLSPGYVLSVGRLNVRKNLSRLMDAYSALSERLDDPPPLVIVGEAEGKPDGGLDTDHPRSHVVFTGSVSDEDLSALYSFAGLFVFPSLDEGFGLPILEAAYFGVPVVSSDIPVFRELKISERFFDPYSVSGIAEAIEYCLVRRPAERGSHIVSANLVLDSYSWESVVRLIRQVVVGGEGDSDARQVSDKR